MKDAKPETTAAPTLANQVLRNASAAVSRSVFVTISGLATSIVLTRLLLPRDYAVYSVLAAIAATLYQFIAGGFASALVSHQRVVEAEDINTTYWASQGALAVVAVIVATLGLLLPDIAGSDRFLACCLAAFLLITPLRFHATVECYMNIRLGRLAIIDSSEMAVFQGVAISGAALGWGSRVFGIALVCGGVVAAILSFVLTSERPARPRLTRLKTWLRRGHPFFLATAIGVGKDTLSSPFLLLAVGATGAGLYGWAYPACAAVLSIVGVASHALYLGAAQTDDPETTAQAIKMATVGIACVAGLLLASLVAISHPLLETVFSPKFIAAVPVLAWLAVGVFFFSLATPLLFVAYADGRTGGANRCQGVFIAMIWGVGIPAAAITGQVRSFVVLYALGAAVMLILMLRSTERRYPLSGSMSFVARMFLAGALAALAGKLMTGVLADPWLELMLGGLAAVTVFAAAVLILASSEVRDCISEVRRIANVRAA